GALLVAVKSGEDWKYVGRIGTGFSDEELVDLKKKFDSIERKTAPAKVPSKFSEDATWVTPKIVIEASFRGWTVDGFLRHAAYEGLRKDKDADEVKGQESEKSKDVLESGIEITHPDREIFPKSDVTKLELARYYEEVADRMLPHVVNRPLSLVRCPQGAQKDCFYQRNHDESFPDAVYGKPDPDNKDNTLIYVNDRDGVVALIQMGVIEIHPWGARIDKLEKPDTCIFDLDPGEGVEWDQMVEVAETCRKFLKSCGLTPFAKTSGSKGIHVMVPLIPHADWEQLKDFGEKAVQIIAAEAEEDVEVKMTKSKRKGKVFLDRFRNRRSSTSVAVYSARAKPEGPVSMPIPWTMLPKLKEATAFKVADYEKWLKAGDPWSDYDDSRERLTKKLLESLD
ncbi:MAG: DNA ligase D, partial [Fimbriimonadaceae bacterium]